MIYREGDIPDYFISPSIRVSEIAGKGLGVRAATNLSVGEIIECCPMKVLAPERGLDKPWARLHRVMLETVFGDYIFEWTTRHGAIAFGYGGLYNHSSRSNATVFRLVKQKRMVFVAKQDIREGEEITISYRHVWFVPSEPADPDGRTESTPKLGR